VAGLLDKPKAPKSETSWLEVDELALLLESARILMNQERAAGRRPPLPCAYELVATFILTGAREDEIRRLQIHHLDFDADIINIPGTKTEGANRSMPMHAHLREILLPYVESLGRTSGYVFTTDAGEPVGDWRKTLDLIATRAGFTKGRIRIRVFRTSYITHRLACIDHGAPIDPYQVAREVGHASLAMIMKVYGRVQRRRVRMEELAFRVERIGPTLQERLQALSKPPPPRERQGVKEATVLVGRFMDATSGMSLAEIAAATGIPVPTVQRLRGGKQPTLQKRTKDRIILFLDRTGAGRPRAA
jgi:integrase